jgi:hypothetical protein
MGHYASEMQDNVEHEKERQRAIVIASELQSMTEDLIHKINFYKYSLHLPNRFKESLEDLNNYLKVNYG